jgi:cell division protein FtsB
MNIVMEWQWLFNIVLGALSGITGWVMRTLWVANEAIRDDLRELERSMHETYARRDDFKAYSSENRVEHEEIKKLLREIVTALGGKADR